MIKSGLLKTSPSIQDIKDYFFTSKMHSFKIFFNYVFEIEPGCYLTFDIRNKKYKVGKYWEIQNTFIPKMVSNHEKKLT